MQKENRNETYEFSVEYVTDWGIMTFRPPIIFIRCSGVYSVPKGANAGTAAVA
jgi:hypothetical protein